MEQCTCRSSTSWKHGKINNAIARLEALIESASEANKNTQKSLIEEAKLQIKQKMSDLLRAEAIIKDWVENNKRGNSFEIKLPTQTQRMVKRAMGKDYDSHNITANGIAHGFNNHGENGKKLGPNSIPVRKEDAVLIPYIMTAPDRVEKGSTDIRNRESVRFYKNLSNGYIVVVEKEQMNSSDDMETINFWIEMSPEATNAQQNVVPDINVRNAILSSDVAKIRKDSETAIEKDVENSVKAQYSLQGAFYSNAHHAVEDIKQDKATPQQWIAMLKKNGGLKAGEDKWLGLEDWLNIQQGSVTKQDIIDYINQNSIKIEEVEYRTTSEALSSLQREFDVLTDEFAGNDEEAYQEMINRYGDDFEMAIWNDEVGRLHFNYGFENYADVFGDSKVINSTRLEYTTEGLDNKREIALTVPTIDPYNQSDDIHFGDAGEGRAVAWIRFGETEDAEGNRVLVIDEIQSKRHQDGREKGYRDSNHHEQFENARKAYANAAEAHSDFLAEMKEKYGDPMTVRGTVEERKEARKEWKMQWSVEELGKYDELTDKMHDARKVYDAISDRRSGVPSAPFEKNWQELAMKRMLRYATDFGFDKLAWTTGEQQAKRYDIGTSVNHIHVINSEEERYVSVSPNNGRIIELPTEPDSDVIVSGEYKDQRLQDVFGKELAEKILSVGIGEDVRLAGESLRIGGEGMKGFYDKMLPSFMNKYGKKWGVKVGEVTMPDLEEGYQTMHSVDVTDAMREDVRKGQPLFSLQGNSMTAEVESVLEDYTLNKDNVGDFEYALMQSIAGQSYSARPDYKVLDGVVVRVKGHTPDWDNFVNWETDKVESEKILNVTVGNYEDTDYRRNKEDYESFAEAHPETTAVNVDIEDGTSLADALSQIHEALKAKGIDFEFAPDYSWTKWSEYTPEARYSLASDMARDEQMQSLLKNTPLWNDVAKTMSNADDYTIAVEALNRLDEDAVNSAKEAIDNANGVFAKADATDVANRLERALQMMRNAEVSEGEGPFGKIYRQFKGKAKEAFDYLMKVKEGDALGVYNRKGIGDIDLVWGDKNGGLAHIISKHIGKGKSFANIEDAQNSISDIINNGGVIFENGDKVVISKNGKIVTLRKNFRVKGRKIADKNWILTAYNENAADNTSAISGINQGQAAPTTAISADKGNANSSDVQAKSGKGAKFSLQGGRSIADKYEKKVNTKGKGGALHLSKFNFMEAWQDEMRALKEVQRIIEQEYGIVLESYEDAYMAENAMSSIAKASWDRYINEVYEPMMRIHDEWIRSGESNESINHYLIAKSGLERNREFTVRDAFRAERASMEEPIRDAYRSAIKDLNEKYKPMELDLLNQYRSGAIDKDTYRNERKNLSDAKKAERKPIDDKYQLDMQDAHDKMTQVEEEYKAKRNALRDDLKAGNIGFAEFCRLSDNLALQYSGAEEIADYSGLTALAKIYGRDDFYNFAMGMEDAFERRHSNTDVMWEHINNNTKAAVDYSYKSGITSKQAKEHLDQMFVWYVPMKGNADVEAEDIYTYVNDKSSSFTPTVKRAKGHTKYVSEDVMALIANTMQSAILQGERNKVKQKFLNMVENYPTDLFSVDNGWVELQGNDWVEVFPDINENDTPEEVRSVLPHQFYNLQIFYILLIDYKTNNRSLIMPTLLPGCSRVYVQ